MTEGMIMFLGGQALLVLAAVLGSHITTRTQIAELRGMLTQIQLSISGLKNDHKDLSTTVHGISRHVAIIEGMEAARAIDSKKGEL